MLQGNGYYGRQAYIEYVKITLPLQEHIFGKDGLGI